MTYPDKLSYKTTVTAELRHDMMALGGHGRRYLELGCDVGYTLLSIAPSFSECTGIDLDPARILIARDNAARAAVTGCAFINGDSSNVPDGRWDVVLIDADHAYDAVKRDYGRIVGALAPGETTIVFHDYGLASAGVRRFVDELVAIGYEARVVGRHDGWNPLGGATDGPEAMAIRVHV